MLECMIQNKTDVIEISLLSPTSGHFSQCHTQFPFISLMYLLQEVLDAVDLKEPASLEVPRGYAPNSQGCGTQQSLNE